MQKNVDNIAKCTEWLNTYSTLRQLKNTEESFTQSIKNGIIDDAGATSTILMLKKQEVQLKKKLIDEVHVTKNGTKRKITYDEKKELYYSKMPNGNRLYAKDEATLIDKIMAFYGLCVTDLKFETVFNQAVEHKDRTEAVNEDTLNYLKSTFRRFINKKLANTDIRKIDSDMLAEYTLRMLREAQTVDEQGVTHKIKKKAYLAYKSVLNVTFQYALAKDIITANPLLKLKNKAFYKECDCSKPVSDEKILSDEEIESVEACIRARMRAKRYDGYFINGYAILFSIKTGVRVAEIPALKWSDIKENCIHIHAQQLSHYRKGGTEYYLAGWTKDERGESKGGRKFPLTCEIRALLDELRELQAQKGIKSDYIFCNVDGEWIKTDAYISCLHRLLASMSYDVTNNHAFRMSLNSNVLDAKLHLPAAKRAELLGHSVETNLKYYTYAEKQDMDDLVELFDSAAPKPAKTQEVAPMSHQNLIKFDKNRSLKSNKFKAST